MEWYNVVLLLLGGVGGFGGFIALYKAKSEKTSIDIQNLSQMLDEARKMYNTMCEEKEQVKADFDTYKKDNMQYISEFKERFSKLEKRVDKAEKGEDHSECRAEPWMIAIVESAFYVVGAR